MLASLPLLARITVWVCVAHCWIIICTIVYVELEAVPSSTESINNQPTRPLTQFEIVSRLLLDLKTDFSDLEQRTVFQKEYERRWKANIKLLGQKRFSDVSKTYVFVMLSHAGIG